MSGTNLCFPPVAGNRQSLRLRLVNVAFLSRLPNKFGTQQVHGYSTYFFASELQPLSGESQAYIIWGTFHNYLLPYLLSIIHGAHNLGALKRHFADRHAGALKRMVG